MKYTKRLYNLLPYEFTFTNKKILVNIEHLKNGINGNPRYKAYISYKNDNGYYITAVYTFNGSYAGKNKMQ